MVVPAGDVTPKRGADEEVLGVLLEEGALTEDAQKGALRTNFFYNSQAVPIQSIGIYVFVSN